VSEAKYIWRNGRMVPWAEATTHVMSHALHYGTSVFEGIRVYDTPNGPAVFRLREHVERLFDSASIYRMKLPYSFDEVYQACKEIVSSNELKSSYIRPVAYYGYGKMGVTPAEDHPVDVFIAAFPWGAYLGEEGLKDGVDVCISSWSRVAPNTIPPMAKAGGNYLSGVLIGQEARRHGYVEGIALAPDGTLSEGAGENIFVIRNGKIITPNAAASILAGITRDTAMTICKEMGYEVKEQPISREMLYLADEIFFTGTAVEITPVRSIDHHPIGSGTRGPITEKVQSAFFGLFKGTTEDKWGWLDPVDGDAPKVRATSS
jgi:branched-chain amino acid aminotransferase